MSVQQWTPIQEGRFHLRLMLAGETIRQYVNRVYASPGDDDETRRELRERIAPLIELARKERFKFQKTDKDVRPAGQSAGSEASNG